MSETKPSPLSQGLTLQNPENKINESKQCFEKQISPQQINPDGNGQKKQQDNDYECEFKLIVKEKFQQKLKNQSTNQFFTVIINDIIQQRVKRNFVADKGQIHQSFIDLTAEVERVQDEANKSQRVTSELERLKAQDQQVKKKIKQLMKRRPKKKALTTYELDPNRDKGFILAKKMNEIKQEREKKYILSKKETEEQNKSLIQSQLVTISCVEKYSAFLAHKTNNRRLRRQSEDFRLPILNSSKNYKNQSEKAQINLLNQNRSKTQKEISEDGRSENLLTVRYDSLALSSRSSYVSKSKDKKRNLPRQIEVLRKSQKITEKYQNRKMVHEILAEIIWTSVKIVESKKQFFHKAPPKPVHQMINTYKENDKKYNHQNGSRPQKFRINLYLKQSLKEKSTIKIQNVKDFETKSDVQKPSNICKINQSFDICLSNRSKKQNSEVQQNFNWIDQNQKQQIKRQSDQIQQKFDNSLEAGSQSKDHKLSIEDMSEQQEIQQQQLQ